MNPVGGWPWSVIGLQGAADAKKVRRAYASKLKEIDQTADIQGFTALHLAYTVALRSASADKDERFSVSVIQAGANSLVPARRLEESGHDAELQEFLAQMATETGSRSLGERIRFALHHRLAKDAETSDAVRSAIGRELVKAYRKADGVWPTSVTAQVLHELDAAYGWLSDYKACQSQFVNQRDFVHEINYRSLLPRAAPPVKVIAPEPPRGQQFRYKKPAPVAKRQFDALVASRWILSVLVFLSWIVTADSLELVLGKAGLTTGLLVLMLCASAIWYLAWTWLAPRLAPRLARLVEIAGHRWKH